MSESFTPELPESFAAEFNCARGIEITRVMRNLGFQFQSGTVEGEENEIVTKRGVASDGSTIEIIFKKGPKYISPAMIEAERKRIDELTKLKEQK